MDCFKTWFAFLSADVLRRCINKSKNECPGCKGALLSPLLHLHNQINLYEKLDRYYNIISTEMDIAHLFDKFIIQFGWLSLNREEFISVGQYFVRFSTPDAIFYGKYITKENDLALYGSFEQAENTTAEKPTKGKKRKKTDIAQDNSSLL